MNARGMGGQHLLLDPADGEDETPEADLARHRDIVPHVPSGEERDESDEHCDAGAGPVLRDRSRGNMDVNVALLEDGRIDIQVPGARLNEI